MLKENLREFDKGSPSDPAIFPSSCHETVQCLHGVDLPNGTWISFVSFVIINQAMTPFPNASLAEQNKRIRRVPQSIWCVCLKKSWHPSNYKSKPKDKGTRWRCRLSSSICPTFKSQARQLDREKRKVLVFFWITRWRSQPCPATSDPPGRKPAL